MKIKIKPENSKLVTPQNDHNMVKTTVTDVEIWGFEFVSLYSKPDYVFDHISDSRFDIVGITET